MLWLASWLMPWFTCGDDLRDSGRNNLFSGGQNPRAFVTPGTDCVRATARRRRLGGNLPLGIKGIVQCRRSNQFDALHGQ
jgi:hypothetical protein